MVLIYLSRFRQLFYKSLESPASSLSLCMKLWIDIFTSDGLNTTVTKFYISCPHLIPKQKAAVCKEPKWYVKEIAYLKARTRGAKDCWGLSLGVECWWKPLLQTPSTLMTLVGTISAHSLSAAHSVG